MRDPHLFEVKQSFEQLIRQYLELRLIALAVAAILGNVFTEVEWIVIHYNIQVLLLAVVGKEGVFYTHEVRMVEHL